MIHPSPTGRGARRRRCEKHAAQRKKDLMWARTAMIRAKEWGVQAELVIAREVFERDNWICHICRETIPIQLRTVRKPGRRHEPLGPVVDHVIPLSKRGPHTMDNCRAAHWTCNAKKSAGDGQRAEPNDRKPSRTTAVVPSEEVPSDQLCQLTGCTRRRTRTGLCSSHQRRLTLHGDPNSMRCGCGCGELVIVAPDARVSAVYLPGHGVQGPPVPVEEKLRNTVRAQPVSDRGRDSYGLTDDCLVWTGSQTPTGYGRMYLRVPGQTRRGRVVLTHRLAYELAHGEGSTDGLTVDHMCGVPLCCNPNHLEAVTLAVNLQRAAAAVLACPKGHPYDEANTDLSVDGHRRCRQCNTDRYHLEILGHEFVPDPQNISEARRKCLTCREHKQSTPQFCPHGHEYTVTNTRLDKQGRRLCQQCTWDRTHVPQYGHPFVPDPDGPVTKRRCLTCQSSKEQPTHCVNGHEITVETTEVTAKGQRNCVICRLNARHIPSHGHEYVIDPNNPTTRRRCLTCHATKTAMPQHCPAGHEYTADQHVPQERLAKLPGLWT